MNNKEMQCLKCCELLPDYEWLDIESRKQVEHHVADCDLCCARKEMILGNFSSDSNEGNNMIDTIDFTDDIMCRITSERKQTSNPFLLKTLAALVLVELLVICFSGFASVVEGAGLLAQFYQYVSEITFPALDESLGLFEEAGYYSVPTEFIPAGFNMILIISAFFIVAALFIISTKRSSYYESK